MPLGQHLGPDQDMHAAGLNVLQQAREGALAAGAVAVDARDARLRKTFLEGGFDPFSAETQRAQIRLTAVGAALWQGLLEPAVMAAKPAFSGMDDQAGVAIPAGRHPAAIMANQGGSVTPAIDEQQRLLPPGQRGGNASCQLGGHALIQPLGADVQYLEARRRRVAGAVGQFQEGVAAFPDIVQALQRGRRRAQQNGRVPLPGAHHGDIARRVAEALLLLKGTVMFLVQNDQAQGWRGGEDRRAGAEQDGGLAPLHGQPGATSLVMSQPGVGHDQRRRKAGAKAGFQLRGQVDLGEQDHRLLSPRQNGLDQAQINLGLAAAGDPLQEKDAEPAQGREDGGDGGFLMRVQHRPGGGGRGIRPLDGRREGDFPPMGEALADETSGGGGVVMPAASQFGRRQAPRTGRAQPGEQLRLPRRPGGFGGRLRVRGRLDGQESPLRFRCGGFALAQQHGQGRGHGLADRVVIVTAGPGHQPQIGGGEQGRVVEDVEGRAQSLRRDVGVVGHLQQNAYFPPAAKGRFDANAGCQ